LWIAKTALPAQGVRHCEKLQRTGEVRWKPKRKWRWKRGKKGLQIP